MEKRMDKRVVVAGSVLAVVVLAVGGYYFWQSQQPPAPAPIAETPVPPVAQAPAPTPASAPAIRNPVEAADATPADAVAETLDAAALAKLLGQKAVLQFLQTDGFVARIVATVDNLDRPHAAPRLWPVNPMPGRFTVEAAGDAERIAPINAKRYAAFVRFIEGIDSPRAASLYFRHYKLFQQAYVELGYPNGYFNDRLVDVIDHLLAAPEPAGPPAVHLIEVKGSTPSTRPWVRYEYVDPGMEALSSGQKMLIRMGPEQARRIKAKLAEFRRLVAKAPR
jgi:hypothetical protein